MIEPTVGRIVYFFGLDGETKAAIVTKVWSTTIVNLQIFDGNGTSYPMVAVSNGQLLGNWDWMPYQKGQVAKTEELEQKLLDKELEK